MTRDVAVLHDQLTAVGGAELVAFELARTFDAPIYAAAIDPEVVPDDVECIEVFDRPVGRRLVRAHYLVADLYQMLGWQHVDELFEFDILILNKNNPGWFVPGDTQTVVKYCHSTPRSLYDRWQEFGAPMWKRALRTPMRVLQRPNATYPDVWVANSELVERRVERYFDIETDRVVHPPVDVSGFSPRAGGETYLTLSRLDPAKEVGEIIQAFNDMPEKKLIVAGDGPERDRLEDMAGGNVEFAGFVDEAEKAELFAQARAFIMNARNEDFGITPIEAFAAGTPVLGVREGFTVHQIADGRNGHTYHRGRLADAVERLETHGVEWGPDRLAKFAERFSAERFRSEMTDIVETAREETRVTPTWRETETETETRLVADGGDS